MFVRNTRQTAISTSSAQHINNYVWKLYYKRFLEITLSLGIYKFLLYAVYTKVSSYLFGSDEDSFFYRRVHEYVVSMLMVHNVSCELFSQVDYRCTYIKYILIRSVRIFLLCYDSALISDCYGLDFTDINDTKRMCFYFFPGNKRGRKTLIDSIIFWNYYCVHNRYLLLVFFNIFPAKLSSDDVCSF